MLVCGVGGGLDIVNAYLFACVARTDGHKVILGAVHPLLMSDIENHKQFCEAGTVIECNTQILKKGRSHNAIVTYHTIKGNYGYRRTFVSWEQISTDGKGIIVTSEYGWMNFFDAGAIHPIKCALNLRS